MGFSRHKTAPKVRDGKVQHKNRHSQTPRYPDIKNKPIIHRERPGFGCQQLITKKQLFQFIDLLPNWNELSEGLDLILLAEGDSSLLGWYRPGIVAICAWETELQKEWDIDFVEEHDVVLDRLGVDREPSEDEDTELCLFDRNSARGFQLMHIFLHELGHHHDLMTTRSQADCCRGEDFAEDYANRYADQLWDKYFKIFPY